MKCAHCKGTGEAPDKIKLECIGCQCRVVVTYADSSDLMKKAENVRCKDCQKP